MERVVAGKVIYVDRLYAEPEPCNSRAVMRQRKASKIKPVDVKVEELSDPKVRHNQLEKKRRAEKKIKLYVIAEELGLLNRQANRPKKQFILDKCMEYLTPDGTVKAIGRPVSISRADYSRLDPDDKRARHNEAEKKRRNMLTNTFANLKRALNLSNDVKWSENKILDACIDKIRQHKERAMMPKTGLSCHWAGMSFTDKSRNTERYPVNLNSIASQEMDTLSPVSEMNEYVDVECCSSTSASDIDECVDQERWASASGSEVDESFDAKDNFSTSGREFSSIYMESSSSKVDNYDKTGDEIECPQETDLALMHCSQGEAEEDQFKLANTFWDWVTSGIAVDDLICDTLPLPVMGHNDQALTLDSGDPILLSLTNIWEKDENIGDAGMPFSGINNNA